MRRQKTRVQHRKDVGGQKLSATVAARKELAMSGDGLYKIPKSPFWYFKLKENGRWRGVSTKTRNYADAKRKRSKVLQDQEEGRWPTGEIARWPFERAASQYILKADMRLRPGSIDATRAQKTWRTSWRNLTRAAGLKGLRFHDLRHQCITELLESGAPEATVLSIAGHVSRKMMEHYSHIRMEARRKALDGLTAVAAVDREANASDLPVN
jgi:hypothetical protein